MIERDKQEFAQILDTLLALFYVTKVEPSVVSAWWSALDDIPIEAFRQAAKQYIRVGKFPPKPSDILNLLTDAMKNQWFSGGEAWSHSLKALDENETVVWTVEASRAFAQARNALELGDKVGARMAFVDAYNRYVDHAIGEGRRPEFIVSQGWDLQKRIEAISKAKALGFLSAEKADLYLRDLERKTSDQSNMAVALLTGKVEVHPSSADNAEFVQFLHEALEKSNAEQAKRLREKQAVREQARAEAEAKRKQAIASLLAMQVKDEAQK